MDSIYKILLLQIILFFLGTLGIFANDYFVHANRLNVRKAPDGNIIGKLQLNQTVEVVGSADEWYEVDFKGTKAFVSKSFVKNRRFTKEDGLKKWFELNPNSEKTPVTLDHEDGFIELCEKTILNGEYLYLSFDDIFSDNYICEIAGCSDTIWLKIDQVLVDWKMITNTFPGINRATEMSGDESSNKTQKGNGRDPTLFIIIVFIIFLIVYSFWKKRNFIDRNDRRGTQWVYAISNPAFGDNIYKIGMTTRPDLKARIKELSNSTSIPTNFEIEAAIKVIDAAKIEKKLHRELSRHRINNKREFFQIEFSQIIYHFEKYGKVYTK